MSPADRTTIVRRLAAALGFDAAGIASAEPLGEAPLQGWIARGFSAGMDWLSSPRNNPRRVLEGARSVISVAVSYHRAAPRSGAPPGSRGVVARYARGGDYHDIVKRRLHALAARLRDRFPVARFRAAVDTAPLPEKALAVRAGLGWAGKHTLLVSPPFGSWVVLGELLTDLDLEPGAPVPDRCGACDRCRSACPTGAIVEPGVLDARRCLSYLTIEHRGPIPPAFRAALGDVVFGCDRCQDACPHNATEALRATEDLRPRPPFAAPSLADLLALSEPAYRALAAGRAIERATFEGLVRNALIVAANTGATEALERFAAATPAGALGALARELLAGR